MDAIGSFSHCQSGELILVQYDELPASLLSRRQAAAGQKTGCGAVNTVHAVMGLRKGRSCDVGLQMFNKCSAKSAEDTLSFAL